VSSSLVLCYHAVSDAWENTAAVRPKQLHQQTAWLARHGFRSVTFTAAVHGRERGRNVCITFDDGFRSVYRYARPILAEFGFVATAFVPTGFLTPPRELSWRGFADLEDVPQGEMTPMSWTDISDLATDGWEIGSHTRTHPRLTETSDDVMHDELRRSRCELSRELGINVTSLAYPYGNVDRRVRDAAAAAGYTAAAGLGPQVLRHDPLCWHRVGIYRWDSRRRFRLKVARPMRSQVAAATINQVRHLRQRVVDVPA
jgi:peptidoglycan/xylan/chitin deacetylase (PgdA/CDA1 family)